MICSRVYFRLRGFVVGSVSNVMLLSVERVVWFLRCHGRSVPEMSSTAYFVITWTETKFAAVLTILETVICHGAASVCRHVLFCYQACADVKFSHSKMRW